MPHPASNNYILSRLLELSESPSHVTEEPRRVIPLANGDNIAQIIFKDEGEDDEGRTFGPAYAENDRGDLVISYGWITRRDAERLAIRLGIEFLDA